MQAVLDPKVKARVAGVVLTSPAVGVQPSHPIFLVKILFCLLHLAFSIPVMLVEYGMQRKHTCSLIGNQIIEQDLLPFD